MAEIPATDVIEPPRGVVREINMEEALALAVDCQRCGRLDDAAALFRRILELSPDHAEAVHYSGILAHQQGRLEDATALLERSLALRPEEADWRANLAVNLHSRGLIAEAIVACERAIALDPDHANAYSNLGALLKLQGRETEAEAAYRRAVELNPEHVGAYVNLGILLAAQHRTREAVACYCKVVTLSPKHPQARRLLAIAHSTIGEIDKAMQIYQEWLDEEPDNPVARHMLAACSGQDVPTRACDDYVATLFDGFAGSFETRLAHLAYQAPQLVARMLEDEAAAGAALDVLDAGCGTGLCGPLIAAHARRLVGIDLSAGMLAHAAEKRVYQELVQGELTAYLRSTEQRFDVIVSADTLVYFGALDDVAAAAAQALRQGGRLIFTVEEWQDAEEGDYRISPHGRFEHSRAYVERTVRAAGFEPRIERAELRMEGGAPVPGLVVRATKAGGA
jgi:predicted TPR repeat methyltransferase